MTTKAHETVIVKLGLFGMAEETMHITTVEVDLDAGDDEIARTITRALRLSHTQATWAAMPGILTFLAGERARLTSDTNDTPA